MSASAKRGLYRIGCWEVAVAGQLERRKERAGVSHLARLQLNARSITFAALGVLIIGVAPRAAQGGAFIFAGEGNGVDVIAHPAAYTGSGGSLNVTICIDPSSANAASMVKAETNIA